MYSKLIVVGLFAIVLQNATGHPQLVAVEDVEDYPRHTQEEPLRLQQVAVVEEEPLTRMRRDSLPASSQQGWGWPKEQHKGWGKSKGWGWPSVGPVFTYVRTDGWSNFQWGVRHKVGGGKGWGKK